MRLLGCLLCTAAPLSGAWMIPKDWAVANRKRSRSTHVRSQALPHNRFRLRRRQVLPRPYFRPHRRQQSQQRPVLPQPRLRPSRNRPLQ